MIYVCAYLTEYYRSQYYKIKLFSVFHYKHQQKQTKTIESISKTHLLYPRAITHEIASFKPIASSFTGLPSTSYLHTMSCYKTLTVITNHSSGSNCSIKKHSCIDIYLQPSLGGGDHIRSTTSHLICLLSSIDRAFVHSCSKWVVVFLTPNTEPFA